MKKMIALVAALTFIGSVSAMAADTDTLTFNASMGTVTFPHKKHQETVKGECKTCHGDKGPGKIEGFSKEWAHKKCKDCHAERNVGQDAKCKFCHKK